MECHTEIAFFRLETSNALCSMNYCPKNVPRKTKSDHNINPKFHQEFGFALSSLVVYA